MQEAFPIRGCDIGVGDSIEIGGVPHEMVDVRSVADGRKRHLEFSDGNAYVLACHMRLHVTRLPSTAHLGTRRAR